MLIAIFILLLIVFFPVISLILGIGFTAFVITYWWAILGFIAICMILNYGRKVNEREEQEYKQQEQQKAIIAALKASKEQWRD